jgi:uncharacterized membrane protein YhaH (DUF805 family)
VIAAVVAWLGGRGRRREYWIAIVAILAAVVTGMLVPVDIPLWTLRWAGLAAWCPIAVRRLRDAGLPLWLAPFPLVIPVAVNGLRKLAMSGLDVRDALGLAMPIGLAGMALVLCLIVLLGVWPPRRPAAPSPEQRAELFG